MREEVVDASGVDVERFAQVVHRHRRALEVPARPARSPRRIPYRHRPVGAGVAALPEDEVSRVILVVLLIPRGPAGGRESRAVDPSQPPVFRRTPDREVHGTLALVGESPLGERFDQPDHPLDEAGRPWPVFRFLESERLPVLEEHLDHGIGDLGQRHAPGRGRRNRPIIDIREVHDLADLVSLEPEVAAEQVFPRKGAEVPDMRAIVHRGPAGVHPHPARFEGLERAEPPRKGVVEPETHRPPGGR